jgi:hypothetical protein
MTRLRVLQAVAWCLGLRIRFELARPPLVLTPADLLLIQQAMADDYDDLDDEDDDAPPVVIN